MKLVGMLWKVASSMQIVVDGPWSNGLPHVWFLFHSSLCLLQFDCSELSMSLWKHPYLLILWLSEVMLVTSVCKDCLNLDTYENMFLMHSVTERGFLFIVLCCVSYASCSVAMVSEVMEERQSTTWDNCFVGPKTVIHLLVLLQVHRINPGWAGCFQGGRSLKVNLAGLYRNFHTEQLSVTTSNSTRRENLR